MSPALSPEALLERAAAGFAELAIDDAKRTSALANLERWLRGEHTAEYHAAIAALVERGDFDLLLYNFFRVMPFGTGGRRGPVGVGPNCFNTITLATSVQGHVAYLRERFGADAPLSVVIAFDVRVFRDLKGRYTGVPTPMMGMRSRDFARVAAEVYAAGGVKVHMPDPEGDWILTTPELSYAIRALGAQGGLNVSASHNHPDDSGGKFYEQRGGQEVPPNDEVFSQLVEQVERADRMDFAEARAAGLVTMLDRALHEQYIDLNASLSMFPSARSAKVVFTNLHGAGDTNVGEALERAGFAVSYVESQRSHDGLFPNVPFRIANPEVPESFHEAQRQAVAEGADLVLSTDPDGDRIGLMAPDDRGQWHFVTGNEIGALVTEHRFSALAERATLPANPVFVTTEVTSRLPVRVAERHGARVVGDLLVGCKYIADVIAGLEERGRFRDLEGTLADYVIGLEESHGVLVSPLVRDKDGAGAAVLLAERASLERDRGRTLIDALFDTYRAVGVHQTSQVSIVIEGAVGMEQIAAIQQAFRDLGVGASLGGDQVAAVDDFLDEAAHGPILSGTDRSARNLLSFRLAGGARVLCRPSGTEPKLKIYTEMWGPALGDDASREAVRTEIERIRARLAQLTDAAAQQAYRALGLDMPVFGLRTSPLLPLQHRREFVEAFVPALEQRARTGEGAGALRAWADERLAHFGKDARGLVRGAVLEWVRGCDLSPAATAAVQGAFS